MSKIERLRSSTAAPKRLLYPRLEGCEILGGISVASAQRMERQGKLKPIRLNGKRGAVYYTHQNLVEVVKAAEAAAGAHEDGEDDDGGDDDGGDDDDDDDEGKYTIGIGQVTESTPIFAFEYRS